MKQLTKGFTYKTILTFLMIAFVQTIIWAQDDPGSTTTSSIKKVTTSETSTWYTSPIVWIVGAAVFILLLVALLRGGSNSGTVASRTDKVTVTKSSSVD